VHTRTVRSLSQERRLHSPTPLTSATPAMQRKNLSRSREVPPRTLICRPPARVLPQVWFVSLRPVPLSPKVRSRAGEKRCCYLSRVDQECLPVQTRRRKVGIYTDVLSVTYRIFYLCIYILLYFIVYIFFILHCVVCL